MPSLVLIGNPENRRVTGFRDAWVRSRSEPVHVFSHLQLLLNPDAILSIDEPEAWVRIDSVGENAEVAGHLRGMGYQRALSASCVAYAPDRPQPRFGQVVAPRQTHYGFLNYLDALRARFIQRPGWRLMQPISSISRLFDKSACAPLHADSGIAVPPFLPTPIRSQEQLDEALAERGWRQAYIKLTCGSSASCLALYQQTKNGLPVLRTSLHREKDGWFNVLKVGRYQRPDRVAEVLAFLLGEGCHVEQAIPKARLDGSFFDLRVLTVAGEAAFTVVRQNHHPITNLHLGGWRGDLAQLKREAGPALDDVFETCRRVAALHETHHLGIDVMFSPKYKTHYVLEANAFGDLLPRLKHQEMSVYEWQVHRLTERL
jgi:hypothetical protein